MPHAPHHNKTFSIKAMIDFLKGEAAAAEKHLDQSLDRAREDEVKNDRVLKEIKEDKRADK